jgi:hypothetical protein
VGPEQQKAFDDLK